MSASISLPVKNINYSANQALFRIHGYAPARELSWMNRVGCDWFVQKAPHDNYGIVQVKFFRVGPAQRTVALPKGSLMRTMKVAYVCGRNVYSLTVDPSLRLPEGVDFECDPLGGFMDWQTPGGDYLSLRPTLTYNTNYYRVNNGILTFTNAPADGYLVIEYLDNGEATPETMVHAGYLEALRLYLTWAYYEKMRDKKAAYDFERQYNESMEISNLTVKCPKLDDIMDVLAPW